MTGWTSISDASDEIREVAHAMIPARLGEARTKAAMLSTGEWVLIVFGNGGRPERAYVVPHDEERR